MSFPINLGTIACQSVISGTKPVLFVSHAGGDWQMYCHWKNHDFSSSNITQELKTVHVAHLVNLDSTLNAVADLPVDMGAERTQIGGPWERYEDRDDEQ